VRRGIASTLQALAFNFEGMMACRWFLAMAEAGFAPGVPYFLSFFYRRKELGFRCGIFLSAAPLATTFAGTTSPDSFLLLRVRTDHGNTIT
jgi:MFS family permease